MKIKSVISSLVTAGIVLSVFNPVFAAKYDNGRFESDGGMFHWDYNEDLQIVTVSPDTTSYPANSRFDSYVSNIKTLGVKNLNSTTNYTYSGFPDGMDVLEVFGVTGDCACIKMYDKCPNVKSLYFYGNTRDRAWVDFTGRSSSTLPELISDTDTEYFLSFREYSGSSSLTVPVEYGDSEMLTYAFTGSTKLKSVAFEDGTEIIPDTAFYKCTNLSSVTIPSGVTNIEYSAFRNCTNLKSITLPSSLKILRFNAFTDSGVTEINYGGTRMMWYGLVQEYDDDGPVEGANVLHLDGCVVHCSDGDILIQKDMYGSRTKYFQNFYGWCKDDGYWHYYYENGASPYNHIVEIDGKKYGFDADTRMITGWGKFNGEWYFFDRSSGEMRTGWVNDSGKWFYLASDGVMATGWQKDGGKWYYLDPVSGAMVKGWLKDGGKWYFLKNNGSMAANEYCDGYWLNSDGTWTYQYRASWRGNYSDGWWYGDSSGWYANNQSLKIDGKIYNFNAGGYCTNP